MAWEADRLEVLHPAGQENNRTPLFDEEGNQIQGLDQQIVVGHVLARAKVSGELPGTATLPETA